jgi:predicted membrane metal-binding protein
MKRPFFIVALPYLSGILLSQFFAPPVFLLLAIGLTIGVTALFSDKARPFLLVPLLVVAGWANMACRTAVLSPVDLRTQMSGRAALASVRGTLSGAPRERVYYRKQEERWASTAPLAVEAIKLDGQWKPSFGTIIVSTSGLLNDDFFNGQTVEIDGVLAPPSGPIAPGLFDPRAFFHAQGIDYQLRAETNDWRVCPGQTTRGRPLAAQFHGWAKKTLALGLPEDQSQKLLQTLMLDWRAPMTRAVEEPFVEAGTFHIFAVDGLRIGLVSGVLLIFFAR